MTESITPHQKKILWAAFVVLLLISGMIYLTVAADYRLKQAQKAEMEAQPQKKQNPSTIPGAEP